MKIKGLAERIAGSRAGFAARRAKFGDSGRYWERRYSQGGTSGSGSYGAEAEWKADCVNAWVAELAVTSVIDWGCGDGNQLTLAKYPKYLGIDRSATAVQQCVETFAGDPTKSFLQYDPEAFHDPAGWLRADLALSMEVIFHLVEDAIFHDYLGRVFDSAERFVIVVNSDQDRLQRSPHERHRRFTPWVRANRPEWVLREKVDPPAELNLLSSAHLYERR